MMKRAAIAIACGMAVATQVPTAHADGTWIAMAISDSTGQIKFSSGKTSQEGAQQSAMGACRKSISDCRLLASGQGGCIALAVGAVGGKYVGGWGPSREEAEAAASATAHGGKVMADHTHCEGDPAS